MIPTKLNRIKVSLMHRPRRMMRNLMTTVKMKRLQSRIQVFKSQLHKKFVRRLLKSFKSWLVMALKRQLIIATKRRVLKRFKRWL